ncbi:DUF971 domain-containing protein [Acidocella sp.]|uniref:DUF971 domain-containing protein n=1 Tax=Acidocella sp. TaxID=50710 RepID=UPI00184A4AC3|nr:DUF971 domain-containing protein [Acidocella sp.]NNM55837.1 DUF971 domain-containing protein [Acidocella sp.]
MSTPAQIKLRRAENLLELSYEDGRVLSLPAEYLRVESPSAEVQGHGPGQAVLVTGKMHVGIIGIEPAGNYALRLSFSDGHDTGIFSWDYLEELGREHAIRWRRYLQRLEAAGASRA